MYRASYDDKGNLAEETDALGRKTKHTYTLWGATQQSGIKTHTRTDAAGATTREEYDRKGNLASLTNALGHTTAYFYDAQNRRVRTQGPDGNTSETLTYNAQGRLSSRTDAAGAKTTFGYDKDGNRTATTNALGHVTRDEFDTRGNRIKSTNALGHTWTYEYDKAGRPTKTFAPTPSALSPSLTETRTYNAQGKLVTVTDASGNTTRTDYDAFGRVIARTDALDRTTRYSYDVKKGAAGCTACNASSMPTIVTLPSGRKTQRVYDADKRLIEETTAYGTPNAATTKHQYDLAGNLVQTTDALGRVTRYEYDAVNRRVAMIYPDNSQRRYGYDAAGLLVAETNELGHTMKRSHDAFGNLLTTTDAAGNVTTQLFEAPGAAAVRRPTGTKSPAGVTVRYEHDALGRRITQVVGPGSDLASSLKHPEASITRHTFDAAGNEIETLDPVGKLTRHTFDARNRRTSTKDALGREWRYGYADTAGASGNPPCCGADPTANNRAQIVTHPDSTQESRITDAAGQLIETLDAKGDRIRYEYDSDGRLISLIDARNNITRWTYDPRGKLESKVYPDKTLELYEHDAAGQLLTRTRPDGTAAVNTYDARGRLLSTRWKDNKAEPTDYTYDAAGHLLTAKNLSATIERSYTATGKIANETQKVASTSVEIDDTATLAPVADPTQAASYQVGYQYNADGRLAALTYPDGTEIAYHYGPRGELTQVTETPTGNPEPGTAQPVATYTRRADNKITELKLANGLTTKKTYDAAGRLAQVLHVAPNGTILSSEASRYDQRDRRTARIKGDGTTDLFAYDPAGQVIAAAYAQAFDSSKSLPVLAQGASTPGSAGGPPAPGAGPAPQNNSAATSSPDPRPSPLDPQQRFAYDPMGNRKQFQDLDGTQINYQTNEANQYQQLSVSSVNSVVEPKYDKNGNLLVDTQNTYTWDADIHLLAVETKSSIKDQASSITSFRYDPLHRRVARLEPNGTLTHFVHDGWNVIGEYTAQQPAAGGKPLHPSSFRLHTSLIWSEDLSGTMQGAGGIAGLLVSRSSTSTSHFHYDSNGNVILLTDADSTPTARYQYDAFGKTLTATGPAAETNRYRFSTKPVEMRSGLCFYGFRYYSPELGRWPSRDPISELGGFNLYAMVTNGAVQEVDVLGRELLGGPNATIGPAGPEAEGWFKAINDYESCIQGCKPSTLEDNLDNAAQDGCYAALGGATFTLKGTLRLRGNLQAGANGGVVGAVLGFIGQAFWDEGKYRLCIFNCMMSHGPDLPPGYDPSDVLPRG